MTIGERIKYLRKEILKIKSSEIFAKEINMSGSNLRSIENNIINATDRVINNISDNFGINKDWLVNGNGDIFNTLAESDDIQILIDKYHLSDKEVTILRNYLDMTEDKRKIFVDLIFELARKADSKDNDTPQIIAASSSETE